MTIFNFISLFGGLALFLYGMRIMSDAMEYGSSGALKDIMGKVTNNVFLGFLLGLLVTAVIQSSTATIVLTSGLVAARIITLHQSIAIVIGANVGTTITGQIIRLLDLDGGASSWLNFFKPSTLAPVAAVIGILLIMAFKFKSSDGIGTVLMGFGILFTGLLNMTEAVSPLSQSETFARLFMTLSDKPVLGYLSGAGVAFMIQSSSATVGILQALATTGKVVFSSIYSVIVGIYLGDCVTTAIVCSIGAKPDAKRTGIVHILFNITGSAIIILVITILHKLGVLDDLWNSSMTSGEIANVHTIFKLSSAFLLLPVCGLFEKLSYVIVRDKADKKAEADEYLGFLDKSLYDSPALALSSVHKVIANIAETSCKNVCLGMECVLAYDPGLTEKVNANEEHIDSLADHVSNYLVGLSSHIKTTADSRRLNYYIQCVSEFERVGDHAVNLIENAEKLQNMHVAFASEAQKELAFIYEALTEIMGYTTGTFAGEEIESAYHIEPVEEVIDDLVEILRENHLVRLREGICNPYASFTFQDILVNVERISDQCSNIGVHTVALQNEAVSGMQHDYIRQLHEGLNETYNEEYKALRRHYFERMNIKETV